MEESQFAATRSVTPDFDQLAKAIANGDAMAETSLYKLFSRGLQMMLERRTRDAALAQDLVHETLMTVIQKLRQEGIENPQLLPRYIHQTAKFLHIGWQRKKSNQEVATDEYESPDENTQSVDTEIEQEETREMVRNLIAEMTVERDRELLYRYYVREQDKQVICEFLDLSAEHFDRVINRARTRFRQLYLQRYAHDTE